MDTPSQTMKATRIFLLPASAFRDALLYLAALQTPGALLVTFFHRSANQELTRLFVSFGLAAALTLILRIRKEKEDLHPAWGLAALGPLVVIWALLMAQWVNSGLEYHDEESLWLYPPHSTLEDCYRGRACHKEHINAFGFRETPNAKPKQETRRIVLIGDSYTFGSGVEDGETLSANLNALAQTDPNPQNVSFLNGGLPGSNLETFPALMHYVERVLQPDGMILLIREDDLDSPDVNTRRNLAYGSFWFRVLLVSNLEALWDFSRRTFAEDHSEPRTTKHLPETKGDIEKSVNPSHQDAIQGFQETLSNSASKLPLLFIYAFPHEYEKSIQRSLLNRSGVFGLSVGNHDTWQGADKLPLDKHWSAKGTREIAQLLWPAIQEFLLADPNQEKRLLKLDDPNNQADPLAVDLSIYPALIPLLESPDEGQNDPVLRINLQEGEARLRLFRCGDGESFFQDRQLCMSLLPLNKKTAERIPESVLREELKRLLLSQKPPASAQEPDTAE